MRRPLELLLKNGDQYRTITIDYREGLRYPHLERDRRGDRPSGGDSGAAFTLTAARAGARLARRSIGSHRMRIGPHSIDPPLILAPMAGVTDKPFRLLCKRLGAGYAVSEMTTADPRLWRTRKSVQRLDHDGEPAPIGVQIAGADPQALAAAARHAVEHGAEIVDINMGCPAKKVCSAWAGSALLKDEALVARILGAVVSAVSVPVTLEDPHRLGSRQPQRRAHRAHRRGRRRRGAGRARPHARHALHGRSRVRNDRGDQASRPRPRHRQRRRDLAAKSARRARGDRRRCAR